MSWLGMAVAVVAIWLAIKMVGALFKVLLWGVALVALYWFAAPHLGLPQVLPSPEQVLLDHPADPQPRPLPEPGGE